MGQKISMAAQAEINAPPAVVRGIFLDFPKYPEWSHWKVDNATGKAGADLAKPDHLKVEMQGMKFSTYVAENTPTRFVWEASLYGVMAAKHFFDFKPSETNPGGTLMMQSEEFTGPLVQPFAPFYGSKPKESPNWERFFADLKKRAEAPGGTAAVIEAEEAK